MDTNELNRWREDYEMGSDRVGRPQWYKMWVAKYADALDIFHLDDDLSDEEKQELFSEIGKAFINGLFYFISHDDETYQMYKPSTRDGRILWNALKRDIDQCYRDYDERVSNGRKGGRPRNQNSE